MEIKTNNIAKFIDKHSNCRKKYYSYIDYYKNIIIMLQCIDCNVNIETDTVKRK